MNASWVAGVLVAGAIGWAIWRRRPSARLSDQISGTTIEGTLDGPGTFEIEVVGESHYQTALERICGGRTEDGVEHYCQAALVLEDANPHDPNAVRIDVAGHTVGYLSREGAKVYRQRLRAAGYPRLRGTCRAVIRGGWDRGAGDRGSFGVRLDLPTEHSPAR